MSAYDIGTAAANLGTDTRIFPSTATFLTEQGGGEGQPGAPVAVAALTNIPCRKSPIVFERPTRAETQNQTGAAETEMYRLLMNSYYPAINTDMEVDVTTGDAVTGYITVRYEITAVEHDGSNLFTRLRIERPS